MEEIINPKFYARSYGPLKYKDPEFQGILKRRIQNGPDSKKTIQDILRTSDSVPYEAVGWAVKAEKPKLALSLLKDHHSGYNTLDCNTGDFVQGEPKQQKFGFMATNKRGYSILYDAISRGLGISLIDKMTCSAGPSGKIPFGSIHANVLHNTIRNRISLQDSYEKRGKGNHEQCAQEIFDIIKCLKRRLVPTNTQDIGGNTLLHSAMLALEDFHHPIDETAIKLFKFLIFKCKVDPEIRNNEGLTLDSFLQSRAEKGEIEAVAKIRQYIAEQNSFLSRFHFH